MNTEEEIEIVRGSGNVFHDVGMENADVLQLRALLASKIISTLEERGLTGKQAEGLTGITEADFSRIRRVKLDRFTIDRLMTILTRLNQRVEIDVRIRAIPFSPPVSYGAYPA
jgi:predicted XRE-type DNA-binding protein